MLRTSSIPETGCTDLRSSAYEPDMVSTSAPNATDEISAGERFEFGRNWASFADEIDEVRVADAITSLRGMLERESLAGLTFLDAGCGSGLFSLAARRLGATVTSFDFDPQSVRTTARLREEFDPGGSWEVFEGSVLDEALIARLGRFDVVYSWGVLHHTGDMWAACCNVADVVGPGGTLFVSLYNDQGLQSRLWRRVKRAYVSGGRTHQTMILALAALRLYLPSTMLSMLRRMHDPSRAAARRPRGMSRRHDLVDWVGGYPFEVARPDEVFDFYRALGFRLERLRTCGGGLGCNQFVFRRE